MCYSSHLFKVYRWRQGENKRDSETRFVFKTGLTERLPWGRLLWGSGTDLPLMGRSWGRAPAPRPRWPQGPDPVRPLFKSVCWAQWQGGGGDAWLRWGSTTFKQPSVCVHTCVFVHKHRWAGVISSETDHIPQQHQVCVYVQARKRSSLFPRTYLCRRSRTGTFNDPERTPPRNKHLSTEHTHTHKHRLI